MLDGNSLVTKENIVEIAFNNRWLAWNMDYKYHQIRTFDGG